MPDALPIARIQLTIQTFNEIGTDKYTTAIISLVDTPEHPLPACVTLQEDNQKQILLISDKVILEFILAPADQYMPLGIAFEKGSGPLDPDGLVDFPITTRLTLPNTFDHVVRIEDRHVELGIKHEFDLIIQRLSDQVLGLIDPEEQDTHHPHPIPNPPKP